MKGEEYMLYILTYLSNLPNPGVYEPAPSQHPFVMNCPLHPWILYPEARLPKLSILLGK